MDPNSSAATGSDESTFHPSAEKPQSSGDWSRRRFVGTGIGAAVGASLLGAGSGEAQTGAALDISFIQVGDPHYRSSDAISSGHNIVVRSNATKMMALTANSAMPGAGTLGNVRGVINMGDICDSGTDAPLTKTQTLEAQWTNYLADFGLLGNEAGTIVKYPVYDAYGNHDQDGFLQQICDRIAARAPQLPGYVAQSGAFTYVNAFGNITVSGVHYAWKWNQFHFINGNIRSGNDSKRYPCGGSYTFLKWYLENKVGASGDPVFIIVHLPPTTTAEGDWPLADRQAFYDLIKQYNTVGILVGHVHAYAFFEWRGPDGTGTVPITVYQVDCLFHSGSTQGIFTAFRIKGDPNDSTKATIYTSQRLRNDTWGLSTSRTISLSSNPGNTGGGGGGGTGTTGLQAVQWTSVNNHGANPYPLAIDSTGTFVEPRQAGIRRIEVLFSDAIAVSNLSTAVTITGVRASGAVTLAGLGITAQVSIYNSTSLAITFTSGGVATALPDASKWRFTLNTAVITSVTDGTALTSGTGNSRIFAGLVGDFDGNGRVTGRDLNGITRTTQFDSEIVDCLRADIAGDGVIDTTDVATAWTNRSSRTDTLGTPA